MKKTLRWSVLLTLLLVCVTIPVMAQRAEAADYDVWVGDTQVTDENKTDVLGDGTVSYDAGTLTLKDAAITDAHGFTNDSGVNCTANIYAEGALTVTGSGTLSGADYGVYVKPDVTGYEKLTFEDAKLNIGSSVAAASTDMGDITVTGASDVTAAGGTYGFEIRIKGIFEVKSGTVTATGSTLAINATVDVSQYTDLFALVNGTAPSASGASEWNKADILGYGGSFKYVRIMPKSDFAEYDLWVGGVQANSLNRDDILGDGTGSAKYDPTTNTLTLNNPKIAGTHEDAQIHSKGIDLTIQGDAELTLPGALMGILTEDGDLTITGGTLTAEGSKWGIRAFTSGVVGFSKITVSGGTVRAKGGDSSSYDYSGIASDAYIYISDGTVFAEGRHGMTAEYLIEISGGQVTAEGSSEGVGIYAYGGDLRITGGHVSAVSNGTKETIAAKYDLEISGEDTVVESLNKQGAAALRSNFGTISIADTLVILEPNDGAVGEKNGKKVVLKSDGTTAADHVIIKKGEYYDLWVGGVRANSVNKDDILGDGTGSAKFVPATNTLTLNNLTYSGKGHEFGEKGSHAAICYLGTDPLNLVISGTNSVTQTEVDGDEAFSFGFFSEGPVTVSGTGVLNVSGGTCKSRTTYGMQIKNDLTVESGTINAFGASTNTGSVSSVGLGAYTLIMNGGTVQGTGGNVQITMTGVEVGTLNMNGGTLTGIGGNKVGVEESPSIGIRVSSAEIHGGTVVGTSRTSSWSVGIRFEGKMNMDGGKVSATGGTATKTGSFGVMFSGGSYHDPSFIISGTAEITATGGAAKTRSSGIYGYQDFVIAGGKITAKGGEAEEDSSGLMTSDYHNGVGIIIKGGTIDAAGGKANSSSYGISSGKYLTVSGGTIKATSTGNNGKGIYADKEDIKISGDKTVVTADGKDFAIYATNGTITIDAPLGILEPNDGEVKAKDSGKAVYDGDTVATHVKIVKGEYYDLWVGGVQANSENKGNILGDTGEPSAVFDPGTNTLTLNNLTYSGKGYEYNENGSQAAVCYLGEEKLNLVLSGTSSVTQTGVTGTNASSFGFYGKADVTVSGDGILYVNGGSSGAALWTMGMHVVQELTMESGTICATGGNGDGVASCGFSANTITMNGGTAEGRGGISGGTGSSEGLEVAFLNVNGGTLTGIGGDVNNASSTPSRGIYAEAAEIHGGTVVVTGGTAGWSMGIYCNTKMIMDGGTMTAAGGTATNSTSAGLYFSKSGYYPEPSYLITGTAELTATGGKAKKSSCGIFSSVPFTIAGGKVSATGGESETEDCNGIYSAKDLNISGGTILAEGDNYGICVEESGDLIIKGGEVTAIGGHRGGCGIVTLDGTIEISGNGTKVTAEGWSALVSGLRSIIINGGEVTAIGTENGIIAWGEIKISGEETVVTADSASYSIVTVWGPISVVDPLAILEPGTGKISDDGHMITDGENVATHVLIAKGGSYTVTWRNYNGAILETDTNVPYGSLPTYDGATPTKAASGGKTYTFKGWTPDVVPVSADATYTATYTESSGGGSGTGTTYTVTWRNYNGAVLETDANVPYGALPTYDGATPKRPASSAYTYTFSGWKPSVVPVTENTTYTADFTAAPILGPGGSSFPFYPFVPGGVFPGIPGTLPGGTPGSTPGGTPGTDPGSTPGTDPGSTPGTDPGSTPGGETGLPFTDVTPDSPYLEDIQYVYENDLMNGMSETEFGENLPLTRGMIVTVLHRMEGRPDVTYTGVFTDVPDGRWFTDGVEWAASHGIVLGYGDGRYGPDDSVTREQLAAILFRYANWKGYDTSVGEDTNILSYDDAFTWGDWAVSALQWACGTGVLEDVPAGMLRPTEAATRGEIAHAIHIFCEEVAK